MKKSKILTPIITIATAGAIVTPIVTLTSCGPKDNEQALNITFTKGAHVLSAEATGDVRTNKSFNILFTFEHGWKEIKDVTIKAGETTLTQGTDYVIAAWNKITVNPNVIKSTEVEVSITSAPTEMSWSIELSAEKKKVNGWYAQPNETLTKNDITITATLGDGNTKPVSFGTSDTDAKLIYNNQDITADFVKNGFTATEDMITKKDSEGKKLQTPLNFSIKNSDGKGFDSQGPFTAYVGHNPTGIEMTAQSGKLVIGDSVWLNKHVKATNEAGFTAAMFAVKSATATYDQTKFAEGLLVATSAGDVTVVATSAFDATLTDEQTYTFDAE